MDHALEKYREIQNTDHGPNWCIFAARFTAGKLVGLFDKNKHMNHFMHSNWVSNQPKNTVRIRDAWARRWPQNIKFFNDVVLPAAVSNPDAGVMKQPALFKEARFSFFSEVRTAQILLSMRVPLVTAVDLGVWPTGRDHFGVLVKSYTSSDVWYIDPWGRTSGSSSIAALLDPTMKTPSELDMNADEKDVPTMIPPPKPLFGYFHTPQGAPFVRILS